VFLVDLSAGLVADFTGTSYINKEILNVSHISQMKASSPRIPIYKKTDSTEIIIINLDKHVAYML